MLETLANVKTLLQISGEQDDPLLDRLMQAAEAFIRDYTGRVFGGGTFVEVHPAGYTLVFLHNFPVETLVSLKVDPQRQFGPYTMRPADSFVLHGERGVIEAVDGPFLEPRDGPGGDWPGALQVHYTTPAGAVPMAVREAFVQLVGFWHRLAKTAAAQNRQLLLSQQTTQGEQVQLKTWPESAAGFPPVPHGIRQLLHPYRLPVI